MDLKERGRSSSRWKMQKAYQYREKLYYKAEITLNRVHIPDFKHLIWAFGYLSLGYLSPYPKTHPHCNQDLHRHTLNTCLTEYSSELTSCYT